MADRPVLAMPRPNRRQAASRPGASRKTVSSVNADRQEARLGLKFQRLEEVLGKQNAFGKLRADPSAIAPERALVFEVAGKNADFYRAARNLPGLEFLGEEEENVAPDEDFFCKDNDGERTDKPVLRRIYFTIPDLRALNELVRLWKRFQNGRDLGVGRTAWRDVFCQLADLRSWGPKDRLTEEAISDWQDLLKTTPEKPVQLEIEFWYRDDVTHRVAVSNNFCKILERVGGKLLHRTDIEEIRYHAFLVQLPAGMINDLVQGREDILSVSDEVMYLRPQSVVSGRVEGDVTEIVETRVGENVRPKHPVVALLDGVPMANHDKLVNKLVVDDPDGYSESYNVIDQRHGTAMASVILHGDMNARKSRNSVKGRLYVRPVMYPHPVDIDGHREMMPTDRLVVDLVWRTFIRMFDGENGQDPTAPHVRIVNISLGDMKRPFAGVMSPWARLLDYLAWKYRVLIIVSAGNIMDTLSGNIEHWSEFENARPEDRQAIVLEAILRHRARRSLLSPSEAINVVTVGAAHSDCVTICVDDGACGMMSIDPYVYRSLPNVSSALGLGFRRAVKPDILFPGGAEHIRANSLRAPIKISPVTQPGRFFGIGVATPGTTGETWRKCNMSGTSVATALATHCAVRIVEALEETPNDETYPVIDNYYYDVILKAMLIHSARWDEFADRVLSDVVAKHGGRLHWQHLRDDVSRFLGFGCPDVDRVIECTEDRVTMIGWSSIRPRETDRFEIPLPSELSGLTGFRALTVTVAWMTPVNCFHQNYRCAKFDVAPVGNNKSFSIGVKNSKMQPSHYAIGRGTVYHRRWEGSRPVGILDDHKLILDVTCRSADDKFDEQIPYATAVTVEVGQELGLPVYDRMRELLRSRIEIDG